MNVKWNNPIEDEIDAIRDRIYEEIKDMSPAEQTAFVNRRTEPIIKQYGFLTAKSANETPVAANR
jgi:hypothetical protein